MIGVIGLGLIGGSMAKALNQMTGDNVYGYDANPDVVRKAKLVNAIEDELTEELLPLCDLVIVALYPEDTVAAIQRFAPHFKKEAVVLDCAGVKRAVVPPCQKLAEEHGFWFVGGHPMAGLEHAGFEYARKALFSNASMILVPMHLMPLGKIEDLKKLLSSIGFTNIEITSPEDHDRLIAFTSQLAHIVSSAYIKSPHAERHKGFSAGSYNDLTRVAKLNEIMWTELFLKNRDNLLTEVDAIIDHLQEYRKALADEDEKALEELLRAGRLKKEEIDKEIF